MPDFKMALKLIGLINFGLNLLTGKVDW
jgi:hypothetical protein